tara:strand:+ start:525 stop:653 length:129 start_codon:yes stop_codon:yes gene_type:complete
MPVERTECFTSTGGAIYFFERANVKFQGKVTGLNIEGARKNG